VVKVKEVNKKKLKPKKLKKVKEPSVENVAIITQSKWRF
jgi:hypothetical protein